MTGARRRLQLSYLAHRDDHIDRPQGLVCKMQQAWDAEPNSQLTSAPLDHKCQYYCRFISQISLIN